jgi:DNA mismatch endonuclease (patch repair protein)
MRLALVRARLSGWLLHTSGVPGSPDFFFPSARVVVFVDGCFWHGCACGHLPATNKKFWNAKIERNRERDRQTTARLEAEGIKVLRFWEHELKDDLAGCIEKVRTVVANPV